MFRKGRVFLLFLLPGLLLPVLYGGSGCTNDTCVCEYFLIKRRICFRLLCICLQIAA